MNLPRADSAYIPPEKLSGYLLSDSHPVGRGKARFLKIHGFSESDQDRLSIALLEIASTLSLVVHFIELETGSLEMGLSGLPPKLDGDVKTTSLFYSMARS